MPSIKDFENKAKKNSSESDLDLDLKPKKSKSNKRRPGRGDDEVLNTEAVNDDAQDIEAEVIVQEHVSAESAQSSSHESMQEPAQTEFTDMHQQSESDEAHSAPKESPLKDIHIRFMGKEIAHIQTPEQILKLADTVVEEWKNDGDFQALPVGHPVAQIIAAKGLRKAKDIEKKLEEKGVFAMAQIGLSVIKSKLKK